MCFGCLTLWVFLSFMVNLKVIQSIMIKKCIVISQHYCAKKVTAEKNFHLKFNSIGQGHLVLFNDMSLFICLVAVFFLWSTVS